MSITTLPHITIQEHCKRYMKINLERIMSNIPASFATKVFDPVFNEPINN